MDDNANSAAAGFKGGMMHYDQSWMGHGIVGGLQAGTISMLVAVLLFVFFHGVGKRHGWNYGQQVGWTFLGAVILSASGDMWNLFYFNYGRLQSLQLLKVRLAAVHDPDGMGLRVLCELVGVVVGIYLAWAVCSGELRQRFGRKPRNGDKPPRD